MIIRANPICGFIVAALGPVATRIFIAFVVVSVPVILIDADWMVLNVVALVIAYLVSGVLASLSFISVDRAGAEVRFRAYLRTHVVPRSTARISNRRIGKAPEACVISGVDARNGRTVSAYLPATVRLTLSKRRRMADQLLDEALINRETHRSLSRGTLELE